MLHVESSLPFACFVFWYVIFRVDAANFPYEGRKNERYDITPILHFEAKSSIECCALCDVDETCSATNYKRDTSECELLAQKPQIRADFVTEQSWTLFTKSEYYDEVWGYFNHSYYLLVKEAMDWFLADGYCLTLGAELVDIHSPEEHAFVFYFTTSNDIFDVWIGLSDIMEEGTFRWSSGEPLIYTAYNPGEPNDNGGSDCVVNVGVSYRQQNVWDDVPCLLAYAFICKNSKN